MTRNSKLAWCVATSSRHVTHPLSRSVVPYHPILLLAGEAQRAKTYSPRVSKGQIKLRLDGSARLLAQSLSQSRKDRFNPHYRDCFCFRKPIQFDQRYLPGSDTQHRWFVFTPHLRGEFGKQVPG